MIDRLEDVRTVGRGSGCRVLGDVPLARSGNEGKWWKNAEGGRQDVGGNRVS